MSNKNPQFVYGTRNKNWRGPLKASMESSGSHGQPRSDFSSYTPIHRIHKEEMITPAPVAISDYTDYVNSDPENNMLPALGGSAESIKSIAREIDDHTTAVVGMRNSIVTVERQQVFSAAISVAEKMDKSVSHHEDMLFHAKIVGKSDEEIADALKDSRGIGNGVPVEMDGDDNLVTYTEYEVSSDSDGDALVEALDEVSETMDHLYDDVSSSSRVISGVSGKVSSGVGVDFSDVHSECESYVRSLGKLEREAKQQRALVSALLSRGMSMSEIEGLV